MGYKILQGWLSSARLYAVLMIAIALCGTSEAQNSLNSFSQLLQGDIDANADSLEFVGSNIIAEGNVVIRYQNMKVLADKATVNFSTKDLEATGNIKFIYRQQDTESVTMKQLEELKKDYFTQVTIDDYTMMADGRQKVEVTVTRETASFTASYVSGNLQTGALEFKDFLCKFGNFYCAGVSATRNPEGIVTIKDAKFSTCEYMIDSQEHYSVTCSEAKVYPPHLADLSSLLGFKKEKKPLFETSTDQGEYTIYAYNCVFNVGDVPVFWTPFLYKPDDPGILDVQMQAGYDSNWGYFLLMSKKFNIMSGPADISTTLMMDLYSKRGLGYGNETTISTERSKTDIMFYGINDLEPYGPDKDGSTDWQEDNDRLKTPSYRYDFKLSNLTHITPRLDYRMHIEKLSDINFLKDFFPERYENDPQPATYFDLEYQFDRFIASVNVRPRLNDFYSVVQRLPEIRFDAPRQELFNNVYYQSESSFNNLSMSWRDYDRPRTAGNGVDPKDYSTMRFDTVHFLYYPISLDFLNIIPRAGLRLTDYTKTSKNKITTQNLETMFIVDSPDGNPPGDVVNYQGDGGNRFRFVGEVGVEVNTKIYRTWENIRNSYWRIDGLRHVMIPYMNYNFTPSPTVNRDHIYYFDDIDRLDEQHFIRWGLINRLQTRRGAYGKEQIYEWASLENYFDFHLNSQKGYNFFGDFGTKLRFNPFPGVELTTNLLLNAGADDDNPSTQRAGQVEDAKGVSAKWINQWETKLTYTIFDDYKIFTRYNFQNNYRHRGIYSMGSSLETLNATSFFERNYSRWQTWSFGFEFPLPFDDNKTKIAAEVLYDLEAGYFRENKIKITRALHCWEAALEFAQRHNRNYNGDQETDNSFMFMLYLKQKAGQTVKLRQSPAGRSSDQSI